MKESIEILMNDQQTIEEEAASFEPRRGADRNGDTNQTATRAPASRRYTGIPAVEPRTAAFLMRTLNHRPLPIDEGIVEQALSVIRFPETQDPEERRGQLAAILPTAAVFVLDKTEVDDLIDLFPRETGTWSELPPLPYPRVWIEFQAEEPTLPAVNFRSDAMTVLRNWGVAITGDMGSWHVLMLISPEVEREFAIFSLRLSADGDCRLDLLHPADETEQDDLRTIARHAMLLVEAIIAPGVSRSPVTVPRQQRRAHERRFGTRQPEIYQVQLAGYGGYTDDSPTRTAGTQKRRHLVRAHWRRLKSGRVTYVRAHKRGSVLAQWRGRGIYA